MEYKTGWLVDKDGNEYHFATLTAPSLRHLEKSIKKWREVTAWIKPEGAAIRCRPTYVYWRRWPMQDERDNWWTARLLVSTDQGLREPNV